MLGLSVGFHFFHLLVFNIVVSAVERCKILICSLFQYFAFGMFYIFIMIWYYWKCFSWKIKISGRCLLSCPQSMVPIFRCLKIHLLQSERCQGKLLQLLPFQVCPSLYLITPELCGYIKVKNRLNVPSFLVIKYWMLFVTKAFQHQNRLKSMSLSTPDCM